MKSDFYSLVKYLGLPLAIITLLLSLIVFFGA